MTMLFAASYPERTRALILYAPIARSVRADDWPYGRTAEEQERFFDHRAQFVFRNERKLNVDAGRKKSLREAVRVETGGWKLAHRR